MLVLKMQPGPRSPENILPSVDIRFVTGDPATGDHASIMMHQALRQALRVARYYLALQTNRGFGFRSHFGLFENTTSESTTRCQDGQVDEALKPQPWLEGGGCA